MKIQIKTWLTGRIIFEHECENNTKKITVLAAVAAGVNLRDSDLSDSNLRGSDLRGSDLRGSNLRGSNLSDSDLRGSDLRGSNLSDSNLSDSDLSDSDLRGSNLSDSDLRGSNLRGSDLRGSNLRGSNLRDSDLPEIPVIANIHAAVLQAATATPDALNMSDWHICETTHCRAGWVNVLAGEAGLKLEKATSPATAAWLIYEKSSDIKIAAGAFYTDNESALKDMQRCADLENGIKAAT